MRAATAELCPSAARRVGLPAAPQAPQVEERGGVGEPERRRGGARGVGAGA